MCCCFEGGGDRSEMTNLQKIPCDLTQSQGTQENITSKKNIYQNEVKCDKS